MSNKFSYCDRGSPTVIFQTKYILFILKWVRTSIHSKTLKWVLHLSYNHLFQSYAYHSSGEDTSYDNIPSMCLSSRFSSKNRIALIKSSFSYIQSIIDQILYLLFTYIQIINMNLFLLYCVTNTRQLPSFSPRSAYFFWISWSSNFWMAAMLMPVISFISASVEDG